jgi:pullulanase
VSFMDLHDNNFALGYEVKHKDENFIVLFNANPKDPIVCELPEGKWEIIVNPEKAGIKSLGKIQGKLTVEPSSGYVLMKK